MQSGTVRDTNLLLQRSNYIDTVSPLIINLACKNTHVPLAESAASHRDQECRLSGTVRERERLF